MGFNSCFYQHARDFPLGVFRLLLAILALAMPKSLEKDIEDLRLPSLQNSLSHALSGSGLTTFLDSDDFGLWEASVARTLGHHRSNLLTPSEPFEARMRGGQLGDCTVVHIQGRGRLRLKREQCHHALLWLPLRGMTQEHINGREWLAEPGNGLLFRPGDALEGETSEEMEGLSILIPSEWQPETAVPIPPLLTAGPQSQAVLRQARELAAAIAQRPAGAIHAVDHFREALQAWLDGVLQPQRRERLTSCWRRTTVNEARQWMAERLQGRFSLGELSRAVAVSPRQLQYHFQQELGHSPMAEAKRMRLQRLRGLLLDRERDSCGVAELMTAAGLIASGVTSADYRQWCGESPRQTRLRRLGREA
jgi:AraC-like DNA-binding protein